MPVFVALLRGVNVGGNQKLPSAVLKACCERAGGTSVRTYLQSGNVVFASEESSADRMAAAIRAEVKKAVGFEVAVLIRTGAELKKVIAKNPFADAARENGGKVFVVFLQEPAGATAKAALEKDRVDPEELHYDGRHLYASLPNGAGRSKVAQDFTPRKLGSDCTARNWNTVVALSELAAETGK
ncbi:MAG TPA: DUF1697 domain-containing protein [Thermoanaerobaculia bacterium]|nr:DUF1697 domain-containing protein [Thermoanaerobaculia bacterium]